MISDRQCAGIYFLGNRTNVHSTFFNDKFLTLEVFVANYDCACTGFSQCCVGL